MLNTFIRSTSPIVSSFIISKYKLNHRKLLFFNYTTHNLSNKFKDLYSFKTIIYRGINSNNMTELKPGDDYDKTTLTQSNHLDLVFVQSYPEKDSITISFNMTYEGKTKQFNMIRKTSEPLSSTLERIKLNLVKMTKPKKNKKNVVETMSDNFEDVILLLNDCPVSLDVKNINAWVDGAIFKLNNKSYEIINNAPQVESMKLPNCIMKNFVIIPTANLVNCSIDDCEFQWYRQISSQEKEKYITDGVCSHESITFDDRNYWYKISKGLIFCPKVEDIAHYIKVVCKPSNGTKKGPKLACISPTPVELGPHGCPFEKRHEFTKEKIKDSKKFRFVTYNILANLYADSDYSRTVLFSHCPSHALEIDYRRQLLLKEMLGYNADIYCLQEVDKKEFDKTYRPFFHFIGNYSGIFDTKGGQVAEGEATFYHNDKFELINTHKTLLSELIEEKSTTEDVIDSESRQPPIENTVDKNEIFKESQDRSTHFILKSRDSIEAQRCLSKFNDIRKAILAKPELKKRFCDRHTIIQTTLLKFKNSSNNYLLVANTHLYFAPDADHIRLLQGCVCVKYLEYLKEYYKESLKSSAEQLSKFVSPNIYTIFTGDMNSTPECGLFKLLTEGKVDSSLPDWSSAGEDESVLGLEVSTNLRFASAYENISYTNYTPGFNGCLDYIYYEFDYLNCESKVPLPNHEDVTAIGGIPSDVFPSDHLALIADFKMS